jgi:hypothetical protein
VKKKLKINTNKNVERTPNLMSLVSTMIIIIDATYINKIFSLLKLNCSNAKDNNVDNIMVNDVNIHFFF